MKQRAVIGGVDFQFFPRMTGPTQANQVVERVAMAVAIWNTMMHLNTIRACTQDASFSVALPRLASLRLPFPHIGGGFAATPQYGLLAATDSRPPFMATCRRTARPGVAACCRRKRLPADDAGSLLHPASAPPISVVALPRTTFDSGPVQRHIKQGAADDACLAAPVSRSIGWQSTEAGIPRPNWRSRAPLGAVDFALMPAISRAAPLARSLNWTHARYYHEYIAIAQARIVGDAPLFRRPAARAPEPPAIAPPPIPDPAPDLFNRAPASAPTGTPTTPDDD